MWNKIIIDKQPFFIKTNCQKKQWKIVLVNLNEIWSQNLSPEEIVEKCQLLNPLLDVDTYNLDEIISEILENIINYVVFASANEIKLQKEIEGGVFKFAINLTQGNLQDIWEEIIKPLCKNAYEFQHQNEIIIKELKKKDEEITEYKLNGKLLRKEIETERFDDSLFNNTEINFETSNFLSMFNSLRNQNDDSMIKNLSKNKDSQIKEIQSGKEKQNNSNDDIKTIDINVNCKVDDNNIKKEVSIMHEEEIIETTDEVSKNSSKVVDSDSFKSKKLDKQSNESKYKKRPRKELNHFIS